MKLQKTPETPRAGRSNRNFFSDGAFRVTSVQSQATKHDIFLFGPIEDSEQFSDAISVLTDAREADLVVLHLTTPGGDVGATDTFLHYWDACLARKVVIATGGCHSAGTMILLAADEFQLSEGFSALVHNGSFGFSSKHSDVASYVAFEIPFQNKLMRATYEGFMTEDEIEEMIAGKDFWFDRDTFLERCKARAKHFGETLDTSAEEDA